MWGGREKAPEHLLPYCLLGFVASIRLGSVYRLVIRRLCAERLGGFRCGRYVVGWIGFPGSCAGLQDAGVTDPGEKLLSLPRRHEPSRASVASDQGGDAEGWDGWRCDRPGRPV